MSDLPATVAGEALNRRAGVVDRTFRSLRTRNYRLWFIGQTVSQCGTWMQSVAQGWLVYRVLTHNAFDLGLRWRCSSGPCSCSARSAASLPTASTSAGCCS